MPGRLAIYDDMTFKKYAKPLIKNDLVKNLIPRYNTPPTLPIPALLNNGNYLYVHFGFLPSWAKSKSSMNINARSESIYEKITFRDSFKLRRCIIPINGFFEWEKEDKEKTPYLVSSKFQDFLALAGIWDEWYDKELNQNIVTVALITCSANEKLEKIHHRMPVVLHPKDFSKWLYSDDLKEVCSFFKVYPSKNTNIYEVTKEVNKVVFNDEVCIKEIEKKQLGQLKFF